MVQVNKIVFYVLKEKSGRYAVYRRMEFTPVEVDRMYDFGTKEEAEKRRQILEDLFGTEGKGKA